MRQALLILLTLPAMTLLGCGQGTIGGGAQDPLAAPDPDIHSLTPSVSKADRPAQPNPAVCLEAPNKAPTDKINKIYNGTRRPTVLPLQEDQVMAVVGIGIGTSSGSSCSGTLIADDIVLTAVHCTEGMNNTGFYALFGEDDKNPALIVRSKRKREHPELDIAMLELEFAPSTRIDVRPIPITTHTLASSDIGATLEQSGYGRTERGFSDGRFFVAERFDGFNGFNDNNLVVNGQGQRGVCFGDSGGPSMRVSPEGDVRVMGALSNGDSSCVGRDNYARADKVRPWIEEWAGPTPVFSGQPEEPGEPIDPGPDGNDACGEVTLEGSCTDNDGTAVFCEAGAVRREACTGASTCGWSADGGGWRCIEPEVEPDPCEGITHFGRCDGGVLEYCDAGKVIARPCGACGESCVLVDAQFGYGCVETEVLPDLDSDGIPDDLDLCSGSPLGERVWSRGEWIGCAHGQRRDPPPMAPEEDLDRDGIRNDLDLCSDTPASRRVWTRGEWIGCAGGQYRDDDRFK